MTVIFVIIFVGRGPLGETLLFKETQAIPHTPKPTKRMNMNE